MGLDSNQIEAWKQIIPQSTLELLLNPLAQGVGYTISGIYYAIFGKLIKYGVVKKAETDALIKQVSEKYSKIPEERRTGANKGLIYKAFEGSRYSLSSEELRELFSNLIVNSADSKYSNKISPYFSTVLENLSVNDALFLNKFKQKFQKNEYVIEGPDYIVDDALPICRLKLTGQNVNNPKYTNIAYKSPESTFADNNSKTTLKTYSQEIETFNSFNIMVCQYDKQKEHFIDDYNLMRKLLRVDEEQKGIDGKSNHVFYTTSGFSKISAEFGCVELTKLGRSFANIVLL